MVTVTECTTLGKGRLRFHLDNGTELVLYRGEAKQFRMREGSTLSDEEEHQLIYEVVGKRAKRRTMHLLEQMDRTDRALEECYEGDEQEQIIRLLEKKKFDAQNSDQKEFTRVYQYLMRRGFRSNDVLHAMKSKQ